MYTLPKSILFGLFINERYFFRNFMKRWKLISLGQRGYTWRTVIIYQTLDRLSWNWAILQYLSGSPLAFSKRSIWRFIYLLRSLFRYFEYTNDAPSALLNIPAFKNNSSHNETSTLKSVTLGKGLQGAHPCLEMVVSFTWFRVITPPRLLSSRCTSFRMLNSFFFMCGLKLSAVGFPGSVRARSVYCFPRLSFLS